MPREKTPITIMLPDATRLAVTSIVATYEKLTCQPLAVGCRRRWGLGVLVAFSFRTKPSSPAGSRQGFTAAAKRGSVENQIFPISPALPNIWGIDFQDTPPLGSYPIRDHPSDIGEASPQFPVSAPLACGHVGI